MSTETILTAGTEDDDELELPFRDPAVPLTEEQMLLRKRVLHQVENEPETFYMGDWEQAGACGTTRCIAGWAQFLTRGAVYYSDNTEGIPDIEEDAVALLGLTEEEYLGRYSHPDYGLFYLGDVEALERLRELVK